MFIQLLSKKARENLKDITDATLLSERTLASPYLTPTDKSKIKLIRESLETYYTGTDANVTIKSIDDAFQVFASKMRHLEHEELHLITLNIKLNVINYHCVFKGSVSHSIASPREILKKAIMDSAASIIVAHNHPSGNPCPSVQDDRFTQTLKAACQSIDIRLTDHLIIGGVNYSYRQNSDLL